MLLSLTCSAAVAWSNIHGDHGDTCLKLSPDLRLTFHDEVAPICLSFLLLAESSYRNYLRSQQYKCFNPMLLRSTVLMRSCRRSSGEF